MFCTVPNLISLYCFISSQNDPAIIPISSQNNPEMIRTMSVRPPSNAEKIRLVKIGNIDLQPCGGTHIKSTGEVGKIVVSKVEKKGKRNRRVNVKLMN